MRSGSEAFFQVAVALVPALVFGGAMRRGSLRWPSRGWTQVTLLTVVVLGVGVSVAAEIFAIQGVIDPTVPRWKTRFVAFTIVGGTVAIAAATVWSWLGEAIQSGLGTPGGGKLVALVAGLVFALGCLGAAFFFASLGLTQSLDRVDARNSLARAERAVRATSAEFTQADHAVTVARISFITAIAQMRSLTREQFSARVERGIFAIDRIVQPVLDRERPSNATVERARSDLAAPRKRLRAPLYRDLGSPRADPEVHLAALTFDRFIQSEMVRLSAKLKSADARRFLRRACRMVQETGAAEHPPSAC
jgi:hypothetical protein